MTLCKFHTQDSETLGASVQSVVAVALDSCSHVFSAISQFNLVGRLNLHAL